MCHMAVTPPGVQEGLGRFDVQTGSDYDQVCIK